MNVICLINFIMQTLFLPAPSQGGISFSVFFALKHPQ